MSKEALKIAKAAATDLLLKGKLTPGHLKKLAASAYKDPRSAALHAMNFVIKKGIPEIAEYLVPGTKESMKIANFGSGFRKRHIMHGGGTGRGGRGRPSPAQLRARRLFAARYGGKKYKRGGKFGKRRRMY